MMEKIYDRIISELEKFFSSCGKEKAVIGMSGGIDSSLCARLVVDALGKDNVHGLIMPMKGVSSEGNVDDTIEYCKQLGIDFTIVYINDFIQNFKKLKWKQNKLSSMNTAARIRAVILYNYSNVHDAIVIGTSNKTEIMIGYYTKHGDGAVDVEVICSLFKTEEIELAKFLHLPEKIVNKVPTAELYHGQTDEDELGASYEVIDEILMVIESGGDLTAVEEKHGKEIVSRIVSMNKNSEHKRNMPKVI